MLITGQNQSKKAYGFWTVSSLLGRLLSPPRSKTAPPPGFFKPWAWIQAKIEGGGTALRSLLESAGCGGSCLFMASLLLWGCGPGGRFGDGRHYDCSGADKEGIRARVQSGWSLSQAMMVYCKEILPPCAETNAYPNPLQERLNKMEYYDDQGRKDSAWAFPAEKWRVRHSEIYHDTAPR